MIGILQSFALWRRLSYAVWWVLLSIVGLSVGFFVALVVTYPIVDTTSTSVWLSIFGILAGAIFGTMQWLILRRQASQAAWWVLANAGSLTVIYLSKVTTTRLVHGTIGFILGLTVGSFLAAALTGILLVWLLRQSVLQT